jgi:hypothetical protein
MHSTYQTHAIYLDIPNDIWQRVHLMKLLSIHIINTILGRNNWRLYDILMMHTSVWETRVFGKKVPVKQLKYSEVQDSNLRQLNLIIFSQN